MSDLSQTGPDMESSQETGQLVLVQHNHTTTMFYEYLRYVGAFLWGPRAKPLQTVQPTAQINTLPPVLKIPLDMLIIISEYISPTDFLCLSLTCKGLKESSVVQQAIYRTLFQRDDLPAADYKDFVKTHKPRYDYVLKGLDDTTGPYVENMAMYEWASIGILQHIIALCPKLSRVDFTGIVEPVDFARYRRYGTGCHHGHHKSPMLDIPVYDVRQYEDDSVEWHHSVDLDAGKRAHIEREMSRCHACSDRFQWPLVMRYCPNLFKNLTWMRLNYSGSRHEHYQDSIQGRRQLPLLLKMAPRLQTLSLLLKSPTPYQDSGKRATKKDCITFEKSIAENAGKELEVLELDDMNPLVRNLSDFLRLLEKFPKLKTINLSLHTDLRKHKYIQSADSDGTVAPLDYVSAAKMAVRRGWRLRTSDSGEDCATKIWPYLSLTYPENIEVLRWFLRSNIGWSPIFLWKQYMYHCRWRSCHDAFVIHMPNIVADSPSCKILFEEMRKAHSTVKLQLNTQGSSDSFFAWQMDETPVDDKVRHFLFSGRDRVDAFPWRLDTIGDLIDDLRILWRSGHVFGRHDPWDPLPQNPVTAPEAEAVVAKHLADTREIVEQRLKYEAEHIAPFFRKLHHFCPNLTRLALYIPGPLYPDHDSQFITAVLPGAGWTVKNYGTGAGDYGNIHDNRPYDEGDQTGHGVGCDTDEEEGETDKQLNSRGMISYPQLWERLQKAEEKRIPTIHRVFTRRLRADGTPIPAPLPSGELYNTPRGEDMDCFDVTSIEFKRPFKWLWGEPVAKET